METVLLGRQEYAETWALQKRLVAERQGGGPDRLLIVEHPAVVTVGKEHRGLPPDCGLPVFEVERGGRATYHGPGQLVGYPIVHLEERGLTLDAYLRGLEDALIAAVRPWCDARRLKTFTGVWVGRQKLASIGVAVAGGVTYHGFALNVSTDLTQFARIHPCGLEPATMTSLSALTGREVAMDAVLERVAAFVAHRLTPLS